MTGEMARVGLAGQRLTARRAYEIGLVTELTGTAEEARAAAASLAAAIAERDPAVLAESLRLMRLMRRDDHFHDDRLPIGGQAERRDVGREFFRQHGEDLGGGIDGSRVVPGVHAVPTFCPQLRVNKSLMATPTASTSDPYRWP